MSVSISTFGSSCTITVGSSDTFSNDATTDISVQVNKLIDEVPAGDTTVINLDPGTYGVGTPMLLSSNTSVLGDDATLEYLPGIDSQTNWGLLGNGYPSTQSVSISVQGVTFIISNAHIFGTWFTNAKDIDVQDNTYIGGTDGNAFVSVIDAVASNNVAIGQDNAAYDNWNGDINTVIENNIGYVYGSGPEFDVLMNSSIANLNYAGAGAAYGIPAGNAVNDGIIGNELSSNFPGAMSVEAAALLDHGYTTESDITQQGNVTEGLGVLNSGLDLDTSPQSDANIQDDSFVGIVYNTTQGYAVIESVGQNMPGYQTSNTQMNGNLILGFNTENSVPPLINHGSDVSSVNNASIGESNRYVGAISTYGYGTRIASSGNVTNIGTYISGSGVIPTCDITAPPVLNAPIDSGTSIADLSIDDTTDSNTVSVTLRTTFGTLSLPQGASNVEYTSILGQSAIILTGSLTKVNADLAGLSYTSNAAGWDDSIEINVSDAAGFSATRYIPVDVGNSGSSNDQVTTITPGEVLPELQYTTIAPQSSLSNDTVIASSGSSLINMGSTVSIVFLQTGFDTVIGGNGAGYIATGSGQADINLTGGGDVSISGGSGQMTINAALGDNVIDTGASNALVEGGSGSNTVAGGLGNLTVQGGAGAMYIATLPQDGGNLTADLGTGNTTLFALSGNDYIETKVNTQNFLDLGIGNDCISSAGADIILAGAGNDTIDASSGGSGSIIGGSGSLYFIAGAGNSVVQDGSGSSTVEGGIGNLTVQGGAGAMYIATLAKDGGNLTVNLTWGNATVFALSGNDYVGTNFYTDNFIDLGTGNDCVVSAGAGSDTILTGAGNDTIDASSGGFDSITGGSGSLYFIAGTGNSVINPAAQSTILAGAGNLTVAGGSGSVYFVAGTGNSVVDPAAQSTILAGAGNLTIGGGGATNLLEMDQIIGTSRVITVDYSSADISLSGYGDAPIVAQTQSGDFLNVSLSDGTLLKLYDSQSLYATDLNGVLSLIPWSNLRNPDVVNIDSLLANPVASRELDTSLLETAASEVPSGKTAVLVTDLPSYAGLSNNGTVVLDPTYLDLETPLTGDGVVQIESGSGLAVEGSVASTQTIAFTSTDGSLIIGDVKQFLGTISGFMGDNTIDLSTVPFSGNGFATLTPGNLLQVIENGETAAVQLDPNESYAGNVFNLSSDGVNGTNVVDATDFTVPASATSLSVDASTAETILGNGTANFSATFGPDSNVTFDTNGGSGTVAAGGASALVQASGQNWNVTGDTLGGDTVSASANGSTVTVFGVGADNTTIPGFGNMNSNIISMGADSLSIYANGSNDLITSYEGASGVVSIGNGGHMVVDGGAVTVIASAGSTFAQAAFGEDGGQLDFINNSSAAATVATSLPTGAIGGSTTVFGGAGGGIYAGGLGPSNSLVGGSGLVTLISAGNCDYLSASGTAPGGQNVLQAGSGNATLIGTAASDNNVFYGGTGSDSIVSNGKGSQTYFVGAEGSETLTGSTATGATNTYIFNQDTTGGGTEIITNFALTGVSSSSSHLYINPTNTDAGVSIAGISANSGSGGGIFVSLTDNTTIKLYGVSLQQADASTQAGGAQQLGNF